MRLLSSGVASSAAPPYASKAAATAIITPQDSRCGWPAAGSRGNDRGRDRRDRLERDLRSSPRQRHSRHDSAPDGPGPHPADLLARRPRRPFDRRRGPGADIAPGVSYSAFTVTSARRRCPRDLVQDLEFGNLRLQEIFTVALDRGFRGSGETSRASLQGQRPWSRFLKWSESRSARIDLASWIWPS